MNVRVQFYAQLRDMVGASEFTIEVPDNGTVRELMDAVYRENPSLRSHDKTILVGAGVEFVDRSYRLRSDEVISIMPPVQGG
jgi:molybdopterin synthase catalytic subunit